MKKVLIKNIKGLVQAREESPSLVSGKDMDHLPVLENAWLAIEDDLIVDFGEMGDWPGISDWSDLEIIDADGKYVLPAWVDSHTHLVFAAPREGEFVDRIHGLSYQEIAAKGGGILNSAAKLADKSEEDLFQEAIARAHQLMHLGTGAIEIKSGYGLSLEAELKMLRVIKRLKDELPIPIKATFLGAHAFPAEYKDNQEGYIDLIINEMMPAIAAEGLAEYVDAFCEDGYFSLDQTRRILVAGASHGLKPKIHVNQFTATGGVRLGVEHNAISVDHLEELIDDDLEALKNSSTIPVALPSCSFFLGIPYTPARKIMNAGLPLALATDYNPGSTPSGNMNFVLSLACIRMKMTPNEAINALTINAAAALELSDSMGSITPGKKANVIITKEIPSLAYLPYAFGENNIHQVLINGVVFKS